MGTAAADETALALHVIVLMSEEREGLRVDKLQER